MEQQTLKQRTLEATQGEIDLCSEVIYLIHDGIANDAVWRNHIVGDKAAIAIAALEKLRDEITKVRNVLVDKDF